ncbi:MAG: ribonuclease H-like domain-containing protein [Akkermansia sp.]
MKDIVYFDLETRHSAAEVGGWHNTAEMRMSIGVTYSTANAEYRIYREEDVDQLIDQLSHADLVVGYNHLHFDYGVLQRYTMWDLVGMTVNLDLCKDIEARCGIRLKLDSIAVASLGNSKTAVGTQALKWWVEYVETGDQEKLMEIARYCCFDVKVTRDVHRYGIEHGCVLFDDKKGGIANCPVDWVG